MREQTTIRLPVELLKEIKREAAEKELIITNLSDYLKARDEVIYQFLESSKSNRERISWG